MIEKKETIAKGAVVFFLVVNIYKCKIIRRYLIEKEYQHISL